MVKHIFDCFFSFSEPPEIRTVEGFSAVFAFVRCEHRLCSQTRRDTNFAIPGYSFFCHDTTARGKNKVFSVCGHLCGQSRFYATFCNRGKSCKRRCRKALRHFASSYPGYNHGTPKAGALPTALHPVISLFYPAGRILPNVAPYQLSHTRIFNFCHYTTSKKIIKVFPVRARSYGQTRFCAALSSQPKSRKRRRRKAFRRFVLPSSGYCRGALKRSSLDRSAPDSENTPPACGRRIYYTSFFSGLQGKNVSPTHSPRAAFSASTRSVFSQATPRSSRPMWP